MFARYVWFWKELVHPHSVCCFQLLYIFNYDLQLWIESFGLMSSTLRFALYMKTVPSNPWLSNKLLLLYVLLLMWENFNHQRCSFWRCHQILFVWWCKRFWWNLNILLVVWFCLYMYVNILGFCHRGVWIFYLLGYKVLSIVWYLCWLLFHWL